MNVLAIAPYQELLPLMEDISSEFSELDVTVTLGNLEDALVSALSIFHRDFDAVITRGGTAYVLEDEFSVPVVSIDFSPTDILRCLHANNAQGKRVAMVGFGNMFGGVKEAREFFDGTLTTFPIEFEDELDFVLEDVGEGNFDLVLGDAITFDTATKLGMPAALLSSGAESVREAFRRVSLLAQNNNKSRQTNHILRDIIRTQNIRIAIYDDANMLTYTTLTSQDAPLLDDLANYAQRQDPPKRYLFRHEGTLFTVRSLIQNENGKRLVAFIITSEKTPNKNRFAGITYRSKVEIETTYQNSTYNIVEAGAKIESVLKRVSSSPRPVMIEGETGSGKPHVSELMYLLSPLAGQPFIEIDCDLLDDRSWEFLISSHNSPLYETQTFLNFKSLHMLSAPRWRELLSIIKNSLVAERNKLVFSLNTETFGEEPEVAHYVSEQLSCFTINVPPLREIHIPARAPERYLAALAARDERQDIPVLDPEAAFIVESYNWPRNILQFKQVMNWAYASAQDGVISADVVREALKRDATAKFSANSTPDSASALDLLKPLSETEAEIARMVVENYGGNKTAAAKTLGISRTTLWSMLKR